MHISYIFKSLLLKRERERILLNMITVHSCMNKFFLCHIKEQFAGGVALKEYVKLRVCTYDTGGSTGS